MSPGLAGASWSRSELAAHTLHPLVFWCLNVVCGPSGTASAVLLRAGAVVAGVDLARGRRGAAVADRDLARGPARLASALALDRSVYGTSMLDGSGPIILEPPTEPVDPGAVRCGPRVGVTGGLDTEWRFWIDGDPTVSVYRRHTPRHGAG